MKTLTLEQAQEIIGDDEAIERGYLSVQILADAEKLAESTLPLLQEFDVEGGFPWSVENCQTYAELRQEPQYKDRFGRFRSLHFSNMCAIANVMMGVEV